MHPKLMHRTLGVRSKLNGFTLTEAMVAAVTTMVVVGGAAMGMRSLNSAIRESGDLSGLRSNALTGTRLLRSEVQRSLYLIVRGGSYEDERGYTDMENGAYPEYQASINDCAAIQSGRTFNPFFGMKMAELDTPVVYGLGTANNGMNYSLIRCGPPLSADGRYETESVILSTVLEGIGTIPCDDPSGQCPRPTNKEGKQLEIAEIAANLDTTLLSDNSSGLRSYMEPAIAIQTDSYRKLLKIIDPTTESDAINYSFLHNPGGKGGSQVDLDLIAYARADKVSRTDDFYTVRTGDSGLVDDPDPITTCQGNNCSFYGIPVNTNSVQLVVDGSGSMSACVAWGNTRSSTKRIFFNGRKYFRTRRNCLVTRMESLQSELRNLLNSLPASANVSLQAFSSPGYLNHRNWKDGQLVALTPANLSSALAFVNSLSEGRVTRWGGTHPWDALNKAFRNDSANSIYFLTDGQPNRDPNGGYWSTRDYNRTADRYVAMNNNRNDQLAVNTVSIGLHSPWMEMMSNGASGSYKLVNQ